MYNIETKRKMDEIIGETRIERIAEELLANGIGDVRAAVKEFAERVNMAFYHEFEELIPSIMADKIDKLVKEVCGDGD